jgi:PAS domain S-box-containing protein
MPGHLLMGFFIMNQTGVPPGYSSIDEVFLSLFELNPAAMAISRVSDSKVINVNEALLNLFEFKDKQEVLGKTAAELNLISNPGSRQEVVDMAIKERTVLNLEGTIKTSRGNEKWVRGSILKMDIGAEPHIVSVLIDITERKQAEDKVREINQSLEDIIKERTQAALETELEYRSVIEQATDGIFISDSTGRYLDVNPSACTMLGYSKDEFLVMHMHDIMAPDDVLTNPPKFAELMDGQVVLTRRNLRKKDGSLIPVEINARMLTNGRMLGMVRDITERVKEEKLFRSLNVQLEEKVRERTEELQLKMQALKESEEKFQKAFQASAAGMTITRLSDSVYIDVNNAFLEMIEHRREDVIGKTSAQLGLIIDMKRREEVLNEIRQNGSVKQMEMTVKTRSGKTIDILSSIETIVHNGEKIAINIIYDITERKKAEEKLNEVNRELESFSYSVSHDLRAPLRSIIGYAEILQEDFSEKMDDELKHHLKTISKSAARMSKLIDDLLEFSRIGKQEIAKATVNTRALVEKVIMDLDTSANPRPQFIIGTLPPAVADISMLTQVWLNLISNAVKYSSKKPDPVIHIGSETRDTEIVFFVRDNGAGFNMNYASKLFGVFQRLHGPREFEGTGVGLALVKRIIDKHGGRVWAEAKVNEGASFYFSLPA